MRTHHPPTHHCRNRDNSHAVTISGFMAAARCIMATMTANKRALATAAPSRWYRGANIPMRVIRRFARQVAEYFCPDKIILFGSYAHGQPHADSDVDILVVMPARNQLDQAFRIHTRIDPPF